MPTKRNKGGNQQNYVPAGNGDASGEYADNSSGSNIHFTNFKKPDDETTTETENVVDETKTISNFNKPKEEEKEEIKEETKSAEDNLFSKCSQQTEENRNTFKKVIENSTEESVKILNDYLNQNQKLSITFGAAGRNAAGWADGYSTIRTNHNVHTIRHELGHTFDNWYGKDMEKDPNKFYFMDGDYASVRFVDKETGKTMNETIHEELGVSMYKATIKGRKISYQKLGKDKREIKIAAATKINEVFTKYADKIYDEITGIKNSRERYKELFAQRNDIKRNLDKDLENSKEAIYYRYAINEADRAEAAYREKRRREGAYSVIYDQSPEVVKAREIKREAFAKYEALKEKAFEEKIGAKNLADYEKLSKGQYIAAKKMEGVIGIIGDTFDYLGQGSTFYPTNGHGSDYFNKRKEGGYVMEVFANMFDCYMSKDTWKKDFVKEVFPKTSKIFEQIYYKKGAK